MTEQLKQIESAAMHLAEYLRRGNANIHIVIAQAALINERAKKLISTNEIAGDLVAHR